MTTETEITTPVESADVDTSLETTPVEEPTDTVVDEQPVDEPAVIETEAEKPQELLAGKYKTVDDLVEGYKNAEKFISKANDFEKKYNELLAKQEQEVQRLAQQKLEEAQLRGFQSVEQQEIADKVQVAEFEYYWNNLAQIDPEHAQTVQQCLHAYYQTGHRQYLDEAKRYYASDFIERVALAKNQLESKLTNEFNYKRNQEYEAQQEQLAQVLKADFADFLGDLNSNKGKELALQQFCNAGFITSPADMKAFVDVYSQIAQFERAAQLKEIEAQKVIDETKQKAVINGGSSVDNLQGGLKESYSQADIDAMPQGEFETLLDKHGKEFMNRIR